MSIGEQPESSGDEYERRLVAEQCAWLDSIAERGDVAVAIEIAKANAGEDVCGQWGLVWLRKRGFESVEALKCATALERFEAARIAHNRAHGLPADAVNKFLQTQHGRELYAEIRRADLELAAARRRR